MNEPGIKIRTNKGSYLVFGQAAALAQMNGLANNETVLSIHMQESGAEVPEALSREIRGARRSTSPLRRHRPSTEGAGQPERNPQFKRRTSFRVKRKSQPWVG